MPFVRTATGTHKRTRLYYRKCANPNCHHNPYFWTNRRDRRTCCRRCRQALAYRNLTNQIYGDSINQSGLVKQQVPKFIRAFENINRGRMRYVTIKQRNARP